MEKLLWLIEWVKSGLWSFLVLLIFWPNNYLLWGCLMHGKTFSSTPGLYPLEVIAADSQHSQNIQINKVIGENEKYVFIFTEKTKWTFWPTQYRARFPLRKRGCSDGVGSGIRKASPWDLVHTRNGDLQRTASAKLNPARCNFFKKQRASFRSYVIS